MKKLFLFLISASVLLLLNSCHVGRFFIYNFADIRDNRKFPLRAVENAGPVFSFAQGQKSSIRLPRKIEYKGDSMSFEKMLEKNGTVAFLIIRNDSLHYENYFGGYDAAREIPSFSMAKSFTSALIGFALQDGYIESVNDPVTRYLPDLKDPSYKNITIKHLLDMQSGIRFKEAYFNPFGDVAKYYYGRDLKKYMIKQPIKSAPGEFEYISVNTQLLGWAIERASGKPLYNYLEGKLWKPLGMEYPASWSIDSRKHGMTKAFCCLNACARDFARFGRLYLEKGSWNGKQLLDSNWIRESTEFTYDKNYLLYSYQWWHNIDVQPLKDSSQMITPYRLGASIQTDEGSQRAIIRPANDYYAEGVLGQFIYVYPEKKMIIVRLGKKYGDIDWSRLFLEIARAN